MKNLKASEAVDCSTDFEILRYAQDDRERVQDDRESAQDDSGQCVVSEEILRYAQDDRGCAQDDRERAFWMTVDSVWSARRSFATLRMTYYIV